LGLISLIKFGTKKPGRSAGFIKPINYNTSAATNNLFVSKFAIANLSFSDLFSETKPSLLLKLLSFFTPTEIYLLTFTSKQVRKNFITLIKNETSLFKYQLELLKTIYNDHNQYSKILPSNISSDTDENLAILNDKMWSHCKSFFERLSKISNKLNVKKKFSISRYVNDHKSYYERDCTFYPDNAVSDFSELKDDLLIFERYLKKFIEQVEYKLLSTAYQVPAYHAFLLARYINKTYSTSHVTDFKLEDIASWRNTYDEYEPMLQNLRELKVSSDVSLIVALWSFLILGAQVGIVLLLDFTEDVTPDMWNHRYWVGGIEVPLFSLILLSGLIARMTYNCHELKNLAMTLDSFHIHLNSMENLTKKNTQMARANLFFISNKYSNEDINSNQKDNEKTPLLQNKKK
jgi:hypothetical protein